MCLFLKMKTNTPNRRADHHEELRFTTRKTSGLSTREIETELKKRHTSEIQRSRTPPSHDRHQTNIEPNSGKRAEEEDNNNKDDQPSTERFSDPYGLFTAPSQRLVDEELIVYVVIEVNCLRLYFRKSIPLSSYPLLLVTTNQCQHQYIHIKYV
jgi:hypothetical protein